MAKKSIGASLRDLRLEKQMTMKEIAKQLHIDESTVSKYERDKEQIKDLRLLIEWALILDNWEPVDVACRACPISKCADMRPKNETFGKADLKIVEVS